MATLFIFLRQCTMTCKKGALYKAILDKLKELVPALKPTLCHCDFEKQEQDAMAQGFSCAIAGCWFHHNQGPIYTKL